VDGERLAVPVSRHGEGVHRSGTVLLYRRLAGNGRFRAVMIANITNEIIKTAVAKDR
jgi:hypothetical protein